MNEWEQLAAKVSQSTIHSYADCLAAVKALGNEQAVRAFLEIVAAQGIHRGIDIVDGRDRWQETLGAFMSVLA